MLRSYVDYRAYECWTLGSECDGAFAQFTVAPARETHRVDCDWTDVELASIPCAYSTAEGMLHRAGLGAETVLVTGASGGVGSAAVQLAKRRGATVIAICSSGKADDVRGLGADRVVDRRADLVAELGRGVLDVVVDLVGGEGWPAYLDVLRRGGRYVTAGAIAGPIAQIDLRTVYLNDLTLLGCTFQEDEVFANLIAYVEAGGSAPTSRRCSRSVRSAALSKSSSARRSLASSCSRFRRSRHENRRGPRLPARASGHRRPVPDGSLGGPGR